jgi:hypothetical protein
LDRLAAHEDVELVRALIHERAARPDDHDCSHGDLRPGWPQVLNHSTPRKLILVGEEKGVDVRIALDVVSTDRRYE